MWNFVDRKNSRPRKYDWNNLTHRSFIAVKNAMCDMAPVNFPTSNLRELLNASLCIFMFGSFTDAFRVNPTSVKTKQKYRIFNLKHDPTYINTRQP
jgi:hypothetical protein